MATTPALSIKSFRNEGAWASPATPAKLIWLTTGASKATLIDPNGNRKDVPTYGTYTSLTPSPATKVTWVLEVVDAAGKVARAELKIHALLNAADVPSVPPVVVPPIVIPPSQGNEGKAAAKSVNLGPDYKTIHPGNQPDTRPTLYQPTSKVPTIKGTYPRVNPYEIGVENGDNSDYWSESGQIAYIPDDPKDAGLIRPQMGAHYSGVFAISPRGDISTKAGAIDPITTSVDYAGCIQPLCMVRNYAQLSNEALIIWSNGVLGVGPTQTSREGNARPYPKLQLPSGKIYTSMALSTQNEFLFITATDVATKASELLVVALEAKWLAFHTWPYIAFPNQGSWSSFKLLGSIPIAQGADQVSAATNGYWNGPSQTAGKVLSQINLADPLIQKGFLSGDPVWQQVISDRGYAVVSSKETGSVQFIDLKPLISYVRDSYLKDFAATDAARKTGAFPATFVDRPDIAPKLVKTFTISRPTAVLAGQVIERWTGDRWKAHVATEDGTIHIFDTSSLMHRWSYEKIGDLVEMGSFYIGANPISLAFSRFTTNNAPLVTKGAVDRLNNSFWVACRGDRKVCQVVTQDGKGAIWRTVEDSRIQDPVAVSVAGRFNLVMICDYAGKKVHQIRVGSLVGKKDPKTGISPVYRPGPPDAPTDFEYAGSMFIPGHPFASNSSNIN